MNCLILSVQLSQNSGKTPLKKEIPSFYRDIAKLNSVIFIKIHLVVLSQGARYILNFKIT